MRSPSATDHNSPPDPRHATAPLAVERLRVLAQRVRARRAPEYHRQRPRYRCVASWLRFVLKSGHGLPRSSRYLSTASLREQSGNEAQRPYGLRRNAYVSQAHIKAVVAELAAALDRRFTWRGIRRGNCRRRQPSGRPRRRTLFDLPAWRQRQARPCEPGQRRRLL